MDPVELTLDLTASRQHLIRCRLRFTPIHQALELHLPVWTPGSYLQRDYVRQLQNLELVQAGAVVPLVRREPSVWTAQLKPLLPVEVNYGAMATELTVRTCHLDDDHACLTLAALALQVNGARWTPHHLHLLLPEGWEPFVPLPCLDGPSEHRWIAASFDQLVDTPVEAGPHLWHGFEVHGVPHRWVCWSAVGGDPNPLLERYPQLLDDVAGVCSACCRLMGEAAPAAADYLFVLHLLERGFGGLEHDNATVLQYGLEELAKPGGYRRFLQLVGHEYLHQWNVRRLRPAELTPIDYDRPMVVPTLWFAEGVTSYYDQFLPRLAGIGTAADLWDDLGAELSRYLLTPGRLLGQTLRQSSQEAWVKLYRQDAYSGDNQISYYLKGAVVALVLDLQLRRAGSSLAAVLRALWQTHGRWRRGYSEADLIEAFAAQLPELRKQLPAWLEGQEDPPLHEALHSVGLVLVPHKDTAPFTGLACSTSNSSLSVQKVARHSPAEAAGLCVADELIALDGWRLHTPSELTHRWQEGRRHSLTIGRHGRLRCLSLQPTAPAVQSWRLQPDPDGPAAALALRTQWLQLVPC
ncbi:M61 family metallopeptidase [Synechococcus sp. L2F]|nr:M61 family metallopeptidase [Synechococcus sp. L2F]